MTFLLARVAGREQMGAFALVRLQGEHLASRARPGQFWLARPWSGWDPYLRVPVFFVRSPAADTCWIYPARPTHADLWHHLAEGTLCPLWGPVGAGFPEPEAASNVLLVVAETHVPYVLGLIDRVAARANVVAVVAREGHRLPADLSWLPPSVEFLAVSPEPHALVAALSDLLTWADYLFAAGPSTWPALLVQAWERVRTTLPTGRAYILLPDGLLCGLGVCDRCRLDTPRGPLRVCRKGPVLDLARWWAQGRGRP